MIINFAQRVTHEMTLTQPDGPREAQRKNMQDPHSDHLKTKILSYMTNMISYIVSTQNRILSVGKKIVLCAFLFHLDQGPGILLYFYFYLYIYYYDCLELFYVALQ